MYTATLIPATPNEAGAAFGSKPHTLSNADLRDAMPSDPATAMQFAAAALAACHAARSYDWKGLDDLRKRLTTALDAKKKIVSAGSTIDRLPGRPGITFQLGVTTETGVLRLETLLPG